MTAEETLVIWVWSASLLFCVITVGNVIAQDDTAIKINMVVAAQEWPRVKSPTTVSRTPEYSLECSLILSLLRLTKFASH